MNCVEIPPPLQVNNFNDMLAGDNTFTKIVWKGYNFNFSPDGPRGQNGNSGNIIWKIERFQTQLEIRKVVFQGTITPEGGENDNGYNLSTYTFIDKKIFVYMINIHIQFQEYIDINLKEQEQIQNYIR